MKICISKSNLSPEPNVVVEGETAETPEQIAEAYLKTIEALKKGE
jgi:hypothetical protein